MQEEWGEPGSQARRGAFFWFWSKASLRRNWSGLVGIAGLLGLIGGLGLFTAAGARRTQSAYPRFLRSTNPSTMAVDVGGLDEGGHEILDAIASLPQVEQARAYAAFYVAPWVDGQPDLAQNFETLGSIDGRYFVQDRFTPTSGRLPDPTRADEVAVNEVSARLFGYHVGQQIDFGTVSRADVESADPEAQADLQPRLLTRATIVGIGVFIEEVLQDDTDRSPLVLFTPAYVRQAKGLETYAWQGLILRNGDADIPAVQHSIEQMMGGGPLIFRVTSVDTFHAEQAIRPVSLALVVFSLIAIAACIVLVGQALARHTRGERATRQVARSLGLGPTAVAAAVSIGPAIAVVAGVVLAAVVAIVASPLMPIGQVRRVEIDRGVDVDWAVVASGSALFVVSLLGVLAVATWRESRRREVAASKVMTVGPLARALDAANLPPVVAVGAHFTVGTAHRSRVRSVMASAAIAIAALVAAVTFGASMEHLVARPHLFGWNWDVALVDGAGYGNVRPAETDAALGADPNVEAWGGAFYGASNINGVNVPLLGMDPSSRVTPPIRSGRMVAGAGEVVLGTETIDRLGVDVGDTVRSTAGDLRVVGTATFPTIGVVHGGHTSLGIGGLVVPQEVPGYDRNVGAPVGTGQTPADQYGPNVVFVKFRDGVDKAAAVDHLWQVSDQLADYNGIAVTPVQRSAEIVNADDIKGASTVLAGAVAVAALASFALALAGIVRRRRTELALLKAIGFSGRQLSGAVAWHATTIVLVGLLAGIPLGVLLGRFSWNLFARQLDVLAEPAVPMLVVAVIALVAVVAANLFAAAPTRVSRTLPAAVVLRQE